MTPRAFAILVCLAASGRWPKLRYVAASLACEAFSDDVSDMARGVEMTTAAMLAWLAPTLAMVALGVVLTSWSRWFVSAFAVCQIVAYFVAGAHAPSVALVTMLSCVVAGVRLSRYTNPFDVERSALVALLFGNAAAFALMLLFGVDDAYAKEVVSTSNDLTHIAVAGLVLWAMRR